jgi:hypothetical protein
VLYLPEQNGVSAYGQYVVHYGTYNNSADGLWVYNALQFVTSNGDATTAGIPAFNIMWVLFTSLFGSFVVWVVSHMIITGLTPWWPSEDTAFTTLVNEYADYKISVSTYISRLIFFTVTSFVVVYALGQDDLLLAVLAAVASFTSVAGFLANDLHENRSTPVQKEKDEESLNPLSAAARNMAVQIEDVVRLFVPYVSSAGLMVVVFLAWNRTGFNNTHPLLTTALSVWCTDFMLMVLGAFFNAWVHDPKSWVRYMFYTFGPVVHVVLSIVATFYFGNMFKGKGQT